MLCHLKIYQNLFYRWVWAYSSEIQKGKNTMKRVKNYLICYDISDEKRLSKLARYIEKVAFRIQYSIFYLPNPNDKEFKEIQKEIKSRIDEKEDDVRIYTIKKSGFRAGIAVNLDDPFTIV